MSSIDWVAQAQNADLTIRNFINGQFDNIAESNGTPAIIDKYSPRDGHLLYSFRQGGKDDVDKAVANAREAFNDGRWRALPLQQRAKVICRLADLVEENREQLALYESLDVGKTITRALQHDIPRISGALRNAAALAGQLQAPSGADLGHFAYQRRKPLGVAAGITGWNSPMPLAAFKIGPALMMGNSLVLKPSEFTSLTTSHLAALAIEAGVPAGVLNVVHGVGATVGAALAEHMDVDLLSFVGSSATGKRVMASAALSNMKRVILECGGKSPYIVFEDCPDNLDFIAQDIVDTAFPNQGALCVAGTRLLLQESMREKLLPLIIEKTAAISPSDPLDPNSVFGAIVNEAHMNKVLAYIDSGISEGANLIQGGKRVYPQGAEDLQKGFYIEPTIFDGVDPQSKIAQEEIFGPVLSILTFKDEQEAIRIANNSSFGLAAYAATSSLARSQRLAEQLSVGSLSIIGNNILRGGSVNISSDKHRESGMGFSGALEGLAAYSITTTVSIFT